LHLVNGKQKQMTQTTEATRNPEQSEIDQTWEWLGTQNDITDNARS